MRGVEYELYTVCLEVCCKSAQFACKLPAMGEQYQLFEELHGQFYINFQTPNCIVDKNYLYADADSGGENVSLSDSTLQITVIVAFTVSCLCYAIGSRMIE